MSKKIKRREYKMMLHTDRFPGDAECRRRAARDCWHVFSAMLNAEGFDTRGTLTRRKPGKQRSVKFLDTNSHTLRRDLGLVFRLRRRRDKKVPWDATLKFRSGDRILSDHHGFRCSNRVDGKDKYEEDVKAPYGSQRARFMSLFSRSATAEDAVKKAPKDLGDCLELFKGLGSFAFPDPDTPVQAVNGFEAAEHIFEGATVALTDKVEAECAMVVWTDGNGNPHRPVVAEFSFRYDLTNGGSDALAARNAWRVFETLYGARNWVDPQSMTKTAFVYARR